MMSFTSSSVEGDGDLRRKQLVRNTATRFKFLSHGGDKVLTGTPVGRCTHLRYLLVFEGSLRIVLPITGIERGPMSAAGQGDVGAHEKDHQRGREEPELHVGSTVYWQCGRWFWCRFCCRAYLWPCVDVVFHKKERDRAGTGGV